MIFNKGEKIMSHHEDDNIYCQECGCDSGDHLEDCTYLAEREAEIEQMTVPEAIAYSRFWGNCYCLTTFREANIVDPDRRVKTTPMTPSRSKDEARPLTDRERVAKVQKDRAHIYRRPDRS